ncbi:hypothetical protein JCM5353_000574 [Sporobolomyces roseus]
MSSSSPPPADISDQSLISAPHPPSDSAPPPSSSPSQTTVPPRTYSSQSISIRPPPAYAPNSSVPKFIRLLALIVFLGGSLTAGTAWFYKSIVYPRLVLALRARRELFGYHKSRYEGLFEGLKGFLSSESVKRLGGYEAVEFRRKQREEAAIVTKEGTEEEDAPIEKKNTEESEKEPLPAAKEDDSTRDSLPSLPPPPQLLLPLQTSLSSLHATLSTSSSTSKSNPSNLVQPQGQLMRSFVTFNEYLESELSSVNAANRTLSGYGTTGGSVSGERKVLSEATMGFKSEIRSIKGALLNRRNFVRPEIGVTA